MRILKAMIVAFSIYSKIPMPRFVWESEDMKYHLCFFPWVGLVIGGLEYLWWWVAFRLSFPLVATIAGWGAIPLLITGGFHVDGFMDTMDAIHSYQEKEKKLEILKDPHIGAFCVITLLLYCLVGTAALGVLFGTPRAIAVITQKRGILVLCLSFFVTRILSGISVITMHAAKGKGMLATFSDTAEKKTVLGVLAFQLLAGIGVMAYCNLYLTGILLLIFGGSYLYYWKMSQKQFGGITGDLAGFFVTITELLCAIGAAVGGSIW